MSESRAGWVLTGGQSTRMGRDKALLPWNGRTVVEEVAGTVLEAAGNVTLVGAPERYGWLGLPVIADDIMGSGPLGGLHSALRATRSDWNLLVACDMPRLTPEFLKELLHRAETEQRDCAVPQTAQGIEPLCAVYHRRILPLVQRALHDKQLRMQTFVLSLDVFVWPTEQGVLLENWNTPQDVASPLITNLSS